MEEKKIRIDFTPAIVEKGFDAAKSFLSKLFSPAVEETGLLVKDFISSWRLNNQVKILNKAQEVCLKNGISPKAISLKLLVPFLENASLEEDEYLQDKWATLLANLADSEQNIENHVFPFLLGQISRQEMEALEDNNICYLVERQRQKRVLEELIEENASKRKEAIEEYARLKSLPLIDRARSNMLQLDYNIRSMSYEERKLEQQIAEPEYFSQELKEFEMANIIRLGLIKAIPQHYGYSSEAEIKNDPESQYLNLKELEVEISSEGDLYLVTELGQLFLKACIEKKPHN